MAINNSAINSIYNYYLTTYAPRTDTRFDAHKKSELRGVYNSIVKMNSEAPLYIVDKSQETKEYAVGLKENARLFRNTIASLGGLEDNELLNKKVAAASNDEVIGATYIGDNDEPVEFEITVNKLATSQINEGKMLPSDGAYLAEDTYSFDIGISGLNYEFQYNVSAQDTNKTVQEKLARLISNANIGLDARVTEDGAGNSALLVESRNTGSVAGDRIFTISDDNTSKTAGSVAYLGIDNVSVEPSNSEFLINGNERSASGNVFTVDKQYEIELKRVSAEGEEPVKVGLRADLDSMLINIRQLVDGFNSFVDTADSYAVNHSKSGRLVNEMKAIAENYRDELDNIGIEIRDDGRLEANGSKFKSIPDSEEDYSARFAGLRKFTGAALRKANQVSLNPMQYAEKTIVAYKNPEGVNLATPYVTSGYTGMMFNSYC